MKDAEIVITDTAIGNRLRRTIDIKTEVYPPGMRGWSALKGNASAAVGIQFMTVSTSSLLTL